MLRELATFRGHAKDVTSAAWHPFHEDLFVSGSYDGSLCYWLVSRPNGPQASSLARIHLVQTFQHIRCQNQGNWSGWKENEWCRMTLLRSLKRHPALMHECGLLRLNDQQKSPWSSFDCIEEEQGSRQVKVPVLSCSGRGQGRARGVSAEHGVASGGAPAGDRWRRYDD